jgi:molecular chaperone DnaK
VRSTIDYGIDLGTINSAVAVFDGSDVQVIRNNANSERTPSAVWIDKNERMFVGATARKRLEIRCTGSSRAAAPCGRRSFRPRF